MNQSILRVLSVLSYFLAFLVVFLVLADSATSNVGGSAVGVVLTPFFGLIVTGAVLGGLASGLDELRQIRQAVETASKPSPSTGEAAPGGVIDAPEGAAG